MSAYSWQDHFAGTISTEIKVEYKCLSETNANIFEPESIHAAFTCESTHVQTETRSCNKNANLSTGLKAAYLSTHVLIAQLLV